MPQGDSLADQSLCSRPTAIANAVPAAGAVPRLRGGAVPDMGSRAPSNPVSPLFRSTAMSQFGLILDRIRHEIPLQ